MIEKKAKFVSGPFTNMIFEVLERRKNKLKKAKERKAKEKKANF